MVNMLNEIKFDSKKYKTEEGSAKAFYKALIDYVTETTRGNAEYARETVHLWNPKESAERGYYGDSWVVSWEEGFYEWALETARNWEGSIKASPWDSTDLVFYKA